MPQIDQGAYGYQFSGKPDKTTPSRYQAFFDEKNEFLDSSNQTININNIYNSAYQFEDTFWLNLSIAEASKLARENNGFLIRPSTREVGNITITLPTSSFRLVRNTDGTFACYDEGQLITFRQHLGIDKNVVMTHGDKTHLTYEEILEALSSINLNPIKHEPINFDKTFEEKYLQKYFEADYKGEIKENFQRKKYVQDAEKKAPPGEKEPPFDHFEYAGIIYKDGLPDEVVYWMYKEAKEGEPPNFPKLSSIPYKRFIATVHTSLNKEFEIPLIDKAQNNTIYTADDLKGKPQPPPFKVHSETGEDPAAIQFMKGLIKSKQFELKTINNDIPLMADAKDRLLHDLHNYVGYINQKGFSIRSCEVMLNAQGDKVDLSFRLCRAGISKVFRLELDAMEYKNLLTLVGKNFEPHEHTPSNTATISSSLPERDLIINNDSTTIEKYRGIKVYPKDYQPEKGFAVRFSSVSGMLSVDYFDDNHQLKAHRLSSNEIEKIHSPEDLVNLLKTYEGTDSIKVEDIVLNKEDLPYLPSEIKFLEENLSLINENAHGTIDLEVLADLAIISNHLPKQEKESYIAGFKAEKHYGISCSYSYDKDNAYLEVTGHHTLKFTIPRDKLKDLALRSAYTPEPIQNKTSETTSDLKSEKMESPNKTSETTSNLKSEKVESPTEQKANVKVEVKKEDIRPPIEKQPLDLKTKKFFSTPKIFGKLYQNFKQFKVTKKTEFSSWLNKVLDSKKEKKKAKSSPSPEKPKINTEKSRQPEVVSPRDYPKMKR